MSVPASPEAARARTTIALHRDRVVTELGRAMSALPRDLPRPTLDGSLLRPLLSVAARPMELPAIESKRFWFGALAIQMVHEASLLHDDIIDRASTRRGAPSVVARSGVPAALVKGDHLLTTAYRCAMKSECMRFQAEFVRAVERTVFGELQQCRRSQEPSTVNEALEIAALKTGELFSIAAGLGAMIAGSNPDQAVQVGRRIGRLYQMVDDFLDYCPATSRGKPTFGDYAAGRHTWVVGLAPVLRFDLDYMEVHALLFSSDGVEVPPMNRVLQRLVMEGESVAREAGALWPGQPLAGFLIQQWLDSARCAYSRERQDAEAILFSHPEPAA